RYTVGVWAGNADGESATFLSGQVSAAPVLFDVFDRLGASSWFARPEHALKTVSVCVDDGFLAGGQCQAKEIRIPTNNFFQTVTPFHRRIHLDPAGQFRVHSSCESVSNMLDEDWVVFTLSYWYILRQFHCEF